MARPANAEVDELFEVKTYYYIGAYQQCLNEINKLSRLSSVEKDCFMWRAYIAQNKHRVVLDGIKLNEIDADNVLQAVRRVADYFASPSKRNDIVKYFDEKFSQNFDDDNRPMWCVSAGTVYYNEGLYENALKALHGQFDLECLALTLQCLLRMNRTDLAKKVLAKMQEKDDDATLTQLATAWLNIHIGGEKLQDAYYIFQDFCDKFVPTNMLLNGQAVCYIGQEKYEEAEQALRESLDKDPNNYDTLINLIVLSQQTEKNQDVIGRYLSQIKDSHRNSALVLEMEKKEQEFDRLCMKYEPSVTTKPEVDVL